METMVWILLFSAALSVTLVAALFDYRTGEIPNALTLGTLAVGPFVHVLLVVSLSAPGSVPLLYAVGSVLTGIVVCTVVPYALWSCGALGGGDLKLFAALGALLGVQRGLEVQLLAFLFALLFLPTMLALRGQLRSTLVNAGRLLMQAFVRKSKRSPIAKHEMTEVRFGPAVFAGTLASACLSFWG